MSELLNGDLAARRDELDSLMSELLNGDLAARRDELDSLMSDLIHARAGGARLAEKWEADYAEWRKAHEHLDRELKAYQNEETALAAKVREKRIELFYLVGSKAPVSGVAIKEITKVSYDENSARAWAIEGQHLDFLCLERRSFDAYVKACAKTDMDLPPTVIVEKVPQAQISRSA
ncbi:MAG: hypothetical protein ACYDHX_07870 [Methanothrix sp.]